MATLNNNQCATLLNEAYAMSTGADELDTLALEDIVDRGNDASVIGSQENFTKSLINVMVGRWYTDPAYRSKRKDPYFMTVEEYGAISSFVSVEVPDVQASHAWKDITSGSTTAGVYTLFLPIVDERVYGKTISYELPIAITGEQWDTAFHNASELQAFVNYIFVVVDNKLEKHQENMTQLNRANFMAQKIAYAGSVGATGVHVVDLVKTFCESSGRATDMTVEEFLHDREALNWAMSELIFYKEMIGEMSVLFNTEGRERHVPDDRLVIETLARFDQAIAAVAKSDTYHNDIVSLDNHYTIPSWQALADSTAALSFDATSSIDVELEPASGADPAVTVQQSGIVAFMADKWALAKCLFKKRVAAKKFEPEDITQYYYQFRQSLMNNLTLSAIVFVLEDWEAPEP